MADIAKIKELEELPVKSDANQDARGAILLQLEEIIKAIPPTAGKGLNDKIKLLREQMNKTSDVQPLIGDAAVKFDNGINEIIGELKEKYTPAPKPAPAPAPGGPGADATAAGWKPSASDLIEQSKKLRKTAASTPQPAPAPKSPEEAVTATKTEAYVLNDIVRTNHQITPAILLAIASHPNANAETLRLLADKADASPELLAVIGRRAQDRDILKLVAQHANADDNVRIAILGNAALDEDTKKIIKQSDGFTDDAVLSHVRLVASAKNYGDFIAVLKNTTPALKDNKLILAAASTNHKVIEFIGELNVQDKVDIELIVKLATVTNQPTVLKLLALEPFKSNKRIVEAISSNARVATSPEITPEQAILLINDKTPINVLFSLLDNSKLKRDVKFMSQLACNDIALKLASNDHITSEQAILLIRHTNNYSVLLQLQKNSRVQNNADVMRAIQDGNAKLASSKITIAQAMSLTKSTNPEVLIALLGNREIDFGITVTGNKQQQLTALYNAIGDNSKMIEAVKTCRISKEQIAILKQHSTKSEAIDEAVEENPYLNPAKKPTVTAVPETKIPDEDIQVKVGTAAKDGGNVVEPATQASKDTIDVIWSEFNERAKRKLFSIGGKHEISEDQNTIVFHKNKDKQITAVRNQAQNTITLASKNSDELAKFVTRAMKVIAEQELTEPIVTVTRGNLKDSIAVYDDLHQQGINVTFSPEMLEKFKAQANKDKNVAQFIHKHGELFPVTTTPAEAAKKTTSSKSAAASSGETQAGATSSMAGKFAAAAQGLEPPTWPPAKEKPGTMTPGLAAAKDSVLPLAGNGTDTEAEAAAKAAALENVEWMLGKVAELVESEGDRVKKEDLKILRRELGTLQQKLSSPNYTLQSIQLSINSVDAEFTKLTNLEPVKPNAHQKRTP